MDGIMFLLGFITGFAFTLFVIAMTVIGITKLTGISMFKDKDKDEEIVPKKK